MALDPLDPSAGGVRMKSGIGIIDDYSLKHPLRPGLALIGSSFEHAFSLAKQLETKTEGVRIDRVPTIGGSIDPLSKDCPTITFGGRLYLLGEIGLSYLAYHFHGSNAAFLSAYRMRDWAILQLMISAAFAEYTRTEDLNVVCASVDNELLGIMKHYTSVKHKEILSAIDYWSLQAWVKYWRWYPTQMEIWLSSPSGTTVFRNFVSGIKVRNGESGHRALSFEATLWTEGLDYEFTRPIVDKGYARHLHPLRLERVVSNLNEILHEHKLSIAFETLSLSAGPSAAAIVEACVRGEKESPSKDKLQLALEAGLAIPAALNGLEVFYTTTEIAKKINKLSMKMAQRACDKLLDWAGAE